LDADWVPLAPCALQDGGLAHSDGLLDDVQLAQPIQALLLIARSHDEVVIPHADVLPVPQPVVNESEARALQRRTHAAAAVVAAKR
jgi:hypothetical protein